MSWIAVAFVGAATGCIETVLVADDYNQTCVTNSDCVIQYLGDQCAACATEQVALHRDEIDRLNADRDTAASACPPWSDRFHVECVVPIPTVPPICTEGACAIPPEGAACTFEDGFCRGVDE